MKAKSSMKLMLKKRVLFAVLFCLVILAVGCGAYPSLYLGDVVQERLDGSAVQLTVTVKNGGNADWNDHPDLVEKICLVAEWFHKEEPTKLVDSTTSCLSGKIKLEGYREVRLSSGKVPTNKKDLMVKVRITPNQSTGHSIPYFIQEKTEPSL